MGVDAEVKRYALLQSLIELDPAKEYLAAPFQYRGRLSPRQERMLRGLEAYGWLADALELHLLIHHEPWSVETEKALERRGLLRRTSDLREVYLTLAGWLWLEAHPTTYRANKPPADRTRPAAQGDGSCPAV